MAQLKVTATIAKRLPFAIYYLAKERRVDVDAVLDCRRSPNWTAKRLK